MIPGGLTDWASVRLSIGFMARTETAKDLDDRSVLAQNTDYTRTVSRTLKPNLGRRLEDGAVQIVGNRMTKRPRTGFTRADQREDSIRLEELSQVDTEDIGKSTRAMRQVKSARPLSSNAGERDHVRTTPAVLWVLSVAKVTSNRYAIR
jgi:hypothetical protein